jgi:predicted nucleotidyltransferase/DNA-binding HxlR family transcriptional regulator
MRNDPSGTAILENVFGTKARLTLLRRLSGESQPLTARQLAELTGLNHRTVVEALDPLTHIGVVEKRHAGPSYLYSLTMESLIAQRIVLPALEAERGLPLALREEIVALFAPPAISIVLFGSLQRGEEKRGSDVDVLVVMADGKGCVEIEERALDTGHSFFKRFGRPLSIHCVTLSDVRRGGIAFLSEAARRGETLFGTPLADLGDDDG